MPIAICTNCGKVWHGWAYKYKKCKCECGQDLDVVTVDGMRIVGDIPKEG
ncbi:hypothetical protein ES703_06736 [subsurface metagenome]